MYAARAPLSARGGALHPGQLGCEPVGELTGPVRRASSMTSTGPSSPSPPSARTIGSRFSRSLYVGRQKTRRTAYHRGGGDNTPPERDVADQFDLLADLLELEGTDEFRPLAYRRAAQRMRETGGRSPSSRSTARRRTCRDRQDDRGEDRPDRRRRQDRGAGQARAALTARRRRVHAPPRPRPEDRAPNLAGARRRDARRPEEGRRDRAAPHAHRARPEDRGEHPQGAGHAEEEDGAQAAPRPGAAGRASRRRGPPRAPGRRRGQRGGQRAPPQGAGPRPRHHRHGERPEVRSSTTSRS